MVIKYHKNTVELLEKVPKLSMSEEAALFQWATQHSIELPEAYVEWIQLDQDNLLAKYSNNDIFFLNRPELITLSDGRKGLLFCRENQGNFDKIVTRCGDTLYIFIFTMLPVCNKTYPYPERPE